MTRKRWSELSGRQQAAIVAAAVVQEALAAATLWDLRRRPSTEVRGSKKLWVAPRSSASSPSLRQAEPNRLGSSIGQKGKS
jgi:hypothetical protein